MGKVTNGGSLKLPSGTRKGFSFSGPRPDLDDFARVEALRGELLRLRGEVQRLQEDKRALEARVAFLASEREQAPTEGPEDGPDVLGRPSG